METKVEIFSSHDEKLTLLDLLILKEVWLKCKLIANPPYCIKVLVSDCSGIPNSEKNSLLLIVRSSRTTTAEGA